jgi:ribonuclease HI
MVSVHFFYLEAERTILTYPDDWIYVYTDESAFKGTLNAGYGARIEYPDKTCKELHSPCGSFCTNYEAEALAIEATIKHLSTVFAETPAKVEDIVIFTDGLSVLQALENSSFDNSAILSLALEINRFLHSYAVDLTLQWIPGHSDIQGNIRVETLAK